MRTLTTAIALSLSLGLTACGSGGDGAAPDPTPSPTVTVEPTPDPSPEPTVEPTTDPTIDPTGPASTQGTVVYLLHDGGELAPGGPHLVPVWIAGDGTIETALEALLEDVPGELGPSLSTSVPEGTEFLGVEFVEGVARIDVSEDFEAGSGTFGELARLAQLVFTATRFGGVDAVELWIEGEKVEVFASHGMLLEEPQTRLDYLGSGLVPKVFVDTPAWGEPVGPETVLSGWSRDLFEATFVYEIRSEVDGTSAGGPVTALGSQGWHTFSQLVQPGFAGDALLTVSESSAEDGSITFQRSYPITIAN